jgi:Uma2 family endonuclease
MHLFEETAVANIAKPYTNDKATTHFTLEAYLTKEATSIYKHEYHNGKIIKMANVRGPHSEISVNCTTALKNQCKLLGQNHRFFNGDLKIYIPAVNHGVYADGLAVSHRPEYWNGNNLLLSNPLLIIEVLSKSTESYDRNEKFDNYKTLTSFQEYVLVKQNAHHVEVFYRDGTELWEKTTYNSLEEIVFLKSLGYGISMADIYEHIEF